MNISLTVSGVTFVYEDNNGYPNIKIISHYKEIYPFVHSKDIGEVIKFLN